MVTAGAGAIAVTVTLVFIMQALVLRGELVLNADVPVFDPDIWMEDEMPEPMREPTILPPLPKVLEETTHQLPPIDPIGPTVTYLPPPTSLPSAFGDIVQLDRSAYVKIRTQHQWPSRAIDQGISGWAVLGFTIAATGGVRDAYVIDSSQKMFESAGLKAVQAYKYEPAMSRGKRIATTGQTVRLSWEITD